MDLSGQTKGSALLAVLPIISRETHHGLSPRTSMGLGELQINQALSQILPAVGINWLIFHDGSTSVLTTPGTR